jgi:hypothetical protein
MNYKQLNSISKKNGEPLFNPRLLIGDLHGENDDDPIL